MPNLNLVALPTAQQTATGNYLTAMEAVFEPMAPNLTPDQRETMPKINVANKAFVEDVSNIMGLPAAAAIIPPFLKKSDLDIDLLTFEQMDKILIRLERLVAIVRDIRMVAGSEAYVAGLAVKKMVDAAALAGVNGAGELSAKLAERFAGQGGNGSSNPTNSNTNDPNA